MRTACLASGVVRAALAAVFVVLAFSTSLVAGQDTVQYSKFLMFFELLDQSGELAQEYAAADGDLCQVKGVDCENGEVVVMCVLSTNCIHVHLLPACCTEEAR